MYIHTVKLKTPTFTRLENLAVGFDTPENVIERLLNHYEGVELNNDKKSKKDYTKYLFNNKKYVKGRLVLAVVTDYVKNNPTLKLNDLLEAFPKQLQGSIGVFNELEYIQNKFEGKRNYHFTKDNEILQLVDCKIAVSTEWGSGITGNFEPFLKHAKIHGFNIEPVQ